MDLSLETREGVNVISLPRIPLDTAFVQEFLADVGPLLGDKPQVVLDMKRLLFIDSSGVGALVKAVTAARKAGGDLKLANVPAQVRGVFEVVRLDKVFSTYRTVDDAVRAFVSPPADAPPLVIPPPVEE